MLTIAIAGNPNTGKSTFFNTWSGSKQKVGNWPGVTVERYEGRARLADGSIATLVDLPGMYSLRAAGGQDEQVASAFIRKGHYDVIVNVVDVMTLERNLFLTLEMLALHRPMVLALSMCDVYRKTHGNKPNFELLSRRLGVPVVSADLSGSGRNTLLEAIQQAVEDQGRSPRPRPAYPSVIKHAVAHLLRGNDGESKVDVAAKDSCNCGDGCDCTPVCTCEPTCTCGQDDSSKKVATSEGDCACSPDCTCGDDCTCGPDSSCSPSCTCGTEQGSNLPNTEDAAIRQLESVEPGGEDLIAQIAKNEEVPADVLIAEARYATIEEILKDFNRPVKRNTLSQKLDRIVMHRWLGIPIFLGIMYLLFWFTQVVGGCFIDFFDVAGGAIFVNGTAKLLTLCHAPNWLIQILSTGLGTGVQTLLTFIPPVYFIYLGLSFLEDSGYMARAAVVMDRLMRLLGLPGSAFVPLLVGFGCTAPAIMATRALPSRRDRLLSIFMAPFMSCGARLPVYALFGAAFFGAKAGLAVFALYLVGVLLAVVTGLLLKNTIFQGQHSPFVMELPMYHIPGLWMICKSAWGRLRFFLFKAGKVLICMVALLSLLENVEIGGKSLLHHGGTAVTPVFKPMGITQENWQASVALFVGLFAKEAVVGSLNTLYAAEDAQLAPESPVAAEGEGTHEPEPTILEQLREACATIPENFCELGATLLDPLGLGGAQEEAEELLTSDGADTSVLASLRRKFGTAHNAFAYLLFILLYVPCLAALAAILREAGTRYGLLLAGYLTVLGWCVATLYYQVAVGHQLLWICVPIALLALVGTTFYILGRRVPNPEALAPHATNL